MKRAVGIAWIIAVVAARPCAAEVIEASSKIVGVTVFQDRAMVTRRAEVTLSAGEATVKFGPLPGQLEPNSLMARGTGTAAVTLYGVRLLTTQLATAQDPKVKTFEESIRANQRRQRATQRLVEVLRSEYLYLDSIRAASGEQLSKELVTKAPSASEAAALLTFLDESLLKNAERQQQVEIEQEPLARELETLQRELAELSHTRERQEVAVLVDLTVEKSGPFSLEISYRLPGASWQPAYEARAATGRDEILLDSSALVRQQTGESWDGVEMVLSTAKPALAGSMPELQPWFLKPWEPVPMSKARGAMFTDSLNREDMPAASAPESPRKEEAKVASATVEFSGPTVTFRLPKPVFVLSDWQPQKVSISSTRFSAMLAYEATPKLAPYAFLRAKLTNNTDALYLAGPVAVFVDGAFVSTASLKQIAPSESFDLDLGVDERMKIERKLLKERVEVSLLPGLRGKMKSTEYEWLTTVENLTGRKAAIKLYDLLPVSQREEIVVESIKLTPSEVEKDPEKPGVFHWTVELGLSQKQELRMAYRLRHPVDMQVQ